jgi:hypothetical protein
LAHDFVSSGRATFSARWPSPGTTQPRGRPTWCSFGSELKALSSIVDLSKIPGEAWIDSDGRVRKFAITIPIPQAGQGGKVIEELRFSHFDGPVVVPAPPASETVPFSQVKNVFGKG